MLTLILLLIVGSGLAYLSHNNLTPVAVKVGPYVFAGVPLFYVIIGALLTGLVLAYVISLIQTISASLTIRGKEKEISKNKNEVLELTKRVHKLELENEKLRKDSPTAKPQDPNAL